MGIEAGTGIGRGWGGGGSDTMSGSFCSSTGDGGGGGRGFVVGSDCGLSPLVDDVKVEVDVGVDADSKSKGAGSGSKLDGATAFSSAQRTNGKQIQQELWLPFDIDADVGDLL